MLLYGCKKTVATGFTVLDVFQFWSWYSGATDITYSMWKLLCSCKAKGAGRRDLLEVVRRLLLVSAAAVRV